MHQVNEQQQQHSDDVSLSKEPLEQPNHDDGIASQQVLSSSMVSYPSSTFVQLDKCDIFVADDPAAAEYVTNSITYDETNDEESPVLIDSDEPCCLPLIEAEVCCSDGDGHHVSVVTADAAPVVDDSEAPSSLPSVQAYPINCHPRERCDSADTSYVLTSAPYASDTIKAVPVDYMRPEFIYVSVIKQSTTTKVGLGLKRRTVSNHSGSDDDKESNHDHLSEVYITRIDPNGLFGKTPIERGDVIIAVNGIACHHAKKLSDITSCIDQSTADGTVSILVRNGKGGQPNTVSSTVQKPTIASKVGFAMKDDRGAIIVTRVSAGGLFAGSLLMPGHRVIEINNVNCESASGIGPMETVTIVQSSADYVTVVSRPTYKQSVAMVLSSEKATLAPRSSPLSKASVRQAAASKTFSGPWWRNRSRGNTNTNNTTTCIRSSLNDITVTSTNTIMPSAVATPAPSLVHL